MDRSQLAVLTALVAASAAPAQTPLGTEFSYQGQLKQSGIPANGPHDFEFRLFDAAAGGNQIGGAVPDRFFPGA